MYVFGISAVNVVNWTTFEKYRRTFLKKSIFLSKGPPYGFWAVCQVVFLAEGGAKFENKWGTKKIKRVSTCLRNTHVDGELKIQKFYFVPPLVFHRYPDTDTLLKMHTDTDTYTDTQNSYRYRYQIPIFSSGIGIWYRYKYRYRWNTTLERGDKL